VVRVLVEAYATDAIQRGGRERMTGGTRTASWGQINRFTPSGSWIYPPVKMGYLASAIMARKSSTGRPSLVASAASSSGCVVGSDLAGGAAW